MDAEAVVDGAGAGLVLVLMAVCPRVGAGVKMTRTLGCLILELKGPFAEGPYVHFDCIKLLLL
jgi:hypothetical protein